MAKTKGKPESGNKNIWQKNGIPPLAFCSIGRAAELLTCQEEDIYHWINTRKIFPAICIEAGVNIKVSVTMQDGGASADEIISRIYSVVSKPSKIAISECNTPERRESHTITDLEMQRLIESLPPPPNRFELTATIAGLWEPPLYEPWREGVEKVIDPQGLLFPIEFKSPPDLLISFHPAERITIPAASLMIVREDVEKIYQAGLDGVEMDELPERVSEEPARPKETVWQAEVIFSLLELATGKKMQDVESEPSAINHLLATKMAAKGIAWASPKPQSWNDWGGRVKDKQERARNRKRKN